MKKLKINLIIFISIALLISPIVYATCTETDRGLDFYQKGTTKIGTILPKYYTDYCVTNTQQLEYYCSSPDATSVSQSQGTCPSGYGCYDGACKPLTQVCEDSDNGKDIYTKGTVTTATSTYEDYCTNSDIVLEYFCQDNVAYQQELSCPSGYECSLGRCKEVEVTCTDSDGLNYKSKGYVDIDGSRIYDECRDGDYLKERICSGSESGTTIKYCKDFGSNWACENGACVEREKDCSYDSDGLDYKTKGYITCIGQNLYDECSTLTPGQLLERYCTSGGDCATAKKDCIDFGSNWFCENGVCKESSVVCTDSDGLDYKSRGYVEIDGTKIYDECDLFILKERICDGSQAGTTNKDCTEFGSGWTCENGACVGIECKDSDSNLLGKILGTSDVKEKGSITLNGDKIAEDSCVDESILSEKFCTIGNDAGSARYECNKLGSDWYCLGGACIKSGTQNCSACGIICGKEECIGLGDCVWLKGIPNKCIEKVNAKCEMCGQGVFDRCTQEDCFALGDCKFNPIVGGIGGKCIPEVDYCESCWSWLTSKTTKNETKQCISAKIDSIEIFGLKLTEIPPVGQDEYCPFFLIAIFGISLLFIAIFVKLIRTKKIPYGGKRK